MTHILVVDDEQNLVELVRGYLEHEGFTVSAAGDGPSAVEAVRTERPDLVVLDLMLPGFDGLEVCRRLRQFSDPYVLMLTARWGAGSRGRRLPRETVQSARAGCAGQGHAAAPAWRWRQQSRAPTGTP